jgi:hypothetical protein
MVADSETAMIAMNSEIVAMAVDSETTTNGRGFRDCHDCYEF